MATEPSRKRKSVKTESRPPGQQRAVVAPRARRGADELTLLTAAAAYLASNALGDRVRTQEQIAATLGIKQPRASLLIADAKSRGWLVERIERKYDVARVGKHLHERVLAHYGHDQFLDTLRSFRDKYRLGSRAPRLHVLGHAAQRTPTDFGRVLPDTTDLAVEAAVIVAALLAPVHGVGVCWGYHLGLVVNALAHIPFKRDGRHEIDVVPLAGEPFDANLNRLSSTSLAQQLMTTLNGKSPADLLSLTLVPAVRPHSARTKRKSAFEKYLLEIPGYRIIFGSPAAKRKARVDGLDAILTGVSHVGFPWGRRQRRMYPEQDEFTVLSDALGDIGGVLLLGSKAGPNEELRALQRRWTGLQPEHLQGLARRAADARSNRTPGVICIAAGANKAACCFEALRLGYVNHMIVDKKLGAKLMEVISADLS